MSSAQDAISFETSALSGVNLAHATSLQFGPDGRLYVSQQNGIIKVYTIERNGANNYEVTGTETILSIQQTPNHNDDGSINSLETTRQITGILVKGTAENPVLYVGSSDSRIGGGGTKGDINLDTNSGMISRLTWTGSTWDKVDLIRGLPRSEENHANNGMEFDEINNILYVTVGGHTNAGSPSTNFAFTTEYALSASILSIDMDAIEAMPVRGSGNNKYVYDIPTLDDPGRSNIANPDYDPSVPGSPQTKDINDPFGGNDGLNQGKIIPGGPVQVHSPGYRNSYDLVITRTPGREGRLYTIDNGANGGWGGYPEYEGTDSVTNNYVPGEPGSTGPGQNDAKVNNKDNLHLVSKPGMSPIYGGHPNPIRANPSGAGLYWYDNITETAHFELDPTSDWPPVPPAMANPVEGDFRNPGVNDGALYTWPASTNGFDEYTATKFFNGALAGDLIVTSFDHNVYRVKLTADGEQVVFVEPIASGLNNPLDVVAQGNGEIFEGTIWIAAYSSNTITILEPQFNGAWNVVNSADNSVPTARHEGAYVEAGGKFYLMGGRGSRPLDIYDPVTNTWTTGTDFPQQIHHFQAVELNGLIYVVGAFTGNFPSETPVSNILIYNPATDSWSTGAEIPADRRRGSAGVVVHNDKIYMVCGIINGHTDGWVPWVDVYDPATGSWTELPDAPHSRDHFHAALEDNKIYVAGGRRSGFGGSTFAATVPEVDVYDIPTGTWTTLPTSANIPTPRAGTSTVVFNNEIVVIGGESGSQSIAHNEAEAFDPFTNTWGDLGALNTGRHATQAIVYNGKIYTAAGSANRGGGPELTSQEVFSGTAICTGNNTSYTLDDDNDGYSNADETDSGTNPCSAASIPADNDGDFISDLNDPDDDNDGIPDTSDKFALDAQNGTNTQIPINYPFLNGVPGTGFFGLGLTGLMSNGTDYQDLFDPDHPDLIMGGAVGLASLPANSGDALNNDQQYAFQFGVDITSSTPPFTIHGRVLGSPFFNGQTPLNQSQGIYIGTGDQDNYLKAAVAANNGNPGIRILYESNGSVTYSNTFPISNILQEESVDLYFDVVPASGTVQIKYTVAEGASPTNVGPLINLSGPVLNAVQTTAAMAVGIIASSGSPSSSFVAAWDFINITSPLAPELRINAGGDAFTYNNENWEADQYYSGTSEDRADNFLAIEGTLKDELYQQYRFGKTFSYNIPVSEEGPFAVKLHFAENYHGVSNSKGIGARIFNVNIENGQAQLTNYDIIEQAGAPATAIVETFNNIAVNDGLLTLDFTTIQDNACIAAIEIYSISNLPPVVRNPGDQPYIEGQSINLPIQAKDPNDGDVLTYSATGLPPPITIDPNTGLISGTLEGEAGTMFPVTVKVEDQEGLSAQTTFNITIIGANNPPVLATIGNQTVSEGSDINASISASDTDGDIPELSAKGLPAFATFTDNNDGTGILSITPGAGDAGTYPITIMATDDEELSDEENLTILVTPGTSSTVLRINAGGPAFSFNGKGWQADQFADAGESYNKDIAINDTENDLLYQSAHFGDKFTYNIPVIENESDLYTVKLHFAEVYHGSENLRVKEPRIFNVNIENNQAELINYDIIATAGASATAIIETFDNINVTDGNVTITFTKVIDKAIVSGIEIIPGETPVTGIEDIVPVENKNILYPNPTKGKFSIDLHVQREGLVQVAIFDITGMEHEVGEFLLPKGASTIQFDIEAENLSSGIYYVKLVSNQLQPNINIFKLIVE